MNIIVDETKSSIKEPNVRIHLLISSNYASSPCFHVRQSGLKACQ